MGLREFTESQNINYHNRIMNTSKYSIHSYAFVIIAAIASLSILGCSSDTHDTSAARNEAHERDSEDAHAHDGDSEKKEGGPNGGRIIASVNPRFEFLVNDDRSIQLTFLDDESHPIAPSGQLITLVGGDRSNPTLIAFTPKGNTLVSSQPLPEGNSIPVVLQIETSPGASTIREKFNVNLSECPTCDYKEYACVCGHAE